MKIGVDANLLLGGRGGVGWHTYYLLRALLDLKEDVEFVGYVRPGSLKQAREEVAAWDFGSRLRLIEAGQVVMHWRGALDRLDLYHGTNFKMQTVGRHGGLVTIHDLWLDRHPEYSTKLFGQRASFHRTRGTAWRARKVITVSEHSANDIVSLYGLPRDRIVVIPNGVSVDFRPMRDAAALESLRRQLALPTDRFILFVGGADPRKNHQTLVRAYARCLVELKDYCVVLVGDPVHRFGSFMKTVQAHALEGRMVFTGRMTVPDLRVLYSHTDLFVFPSLYEGFGMPVLEAMACGAPVVTSNTTALPEVAGDAAVLVNPEDPEELADALIHVLEDAVLREKMRAKGFERVKQFSWEKAARRTLALYREVCEERESLNVTR